MENDLLLDRDLLDTLKDSKIKTFVVRCVEDFVTRFDLEFNNNFDFFKDLLTISSYVGLCVMFRDIEPFTYPILRINGYGIYDLIIKKNSIEQDEVFLFLRCLFIVMYVKNVKIINLEDNKDILNYYSKIFADIIKKLCSF